jgi:hypothetical protein
MAASALVSYAAPKLEVTPEIFECGRVKQTDEGEEFVFSLKNVGDEQLVIEQVRPFCGCTTIELAKDKLAPAEVIELHGVLKTKHYEGPISKAVGITTNDPERKMKLVRVEAKLPFFQPGMRLYPNYVVSGFPVRIWRGNLRAFVWVQNCDVEGVVSIEKVDCPEGWTIREKLPIEVAPENKVKVEFWKELPEGQEKVEEFDGVPFAIYTTHPDHPVLEATLRYQEPKPAPTPPAERAPAKPEENP